MRSLVLAFAMLLAACAAPSQQPAASPAGGTQPGASVPVASQAATPSAPPAPGSGLPKAANGLSQPARVDTSCTSDADCVVKDVGSCCGAMPACVNRDSPTDPAGVRAACSAQDRASVCGFNEITACHCVRGQCAAEQDPVGGWTVDPTPPKPEDR